MRYKLLLTCIKEKKITASVVLRNNVDMNFSRIEDYVIKKGNKHKIDLNNNYGNRILINLIKIAEIEYDFSKQNLSVINIWSIENKKEIIGGTSENFSLGKHLLIEKKI